MEMSGNKKNTQHLLYNTYPQTYILHSLKGNFGFIGKLKDLSLKI